eukprot:1046246-Rhodomonas_salina.1
MHQPKRREGWTEEGGKGVMGEGGGGGMGEGGGHQGWEGGEGGREEREREREGGLGSRVLAVLEKQRTLLYRVEQAVAYVRSDVADVKERMHGMQAEHMRLPPIFGSSPRRKRPTGRNSDGKGMAKGLTHEEEEEERGDGMHVWTREDDVLGREERVLVRKEASGKEEEKEEEEEEEEEDEEEEEEEE